MKTFIKTEEQKDTANFLLQAGVAIAVVGMNIFLLILIAADKLAADNVVTGYLLGLLSALVAFCFPSSIGVQRQQETIAKLADRKETADGNFGGGTPAPTGVAGREVVIAQREWDPIQPITDDEPPGPDADIPDRPPSQRG